jgi:hypothetical protein
MWRVLRRAAGWSLLLLTPVRRRAQRSAVAASCASCGAPLRALRRAGAPAVGHRASSCAARSCSRCKRRDAVSRRRRCGGAAALVRTAAAAASAVRSCSPCRACGSAGKYRLRILRGAFRGAARGPRVRPARPPAGAWNSARRSTFADEGARRGAWGGMRCARGRRQADAAHASFLARARTLSACSPAAARRVHADGCGRAVHTARANVARRRLAAQRATRRRSAHGRMRDAWRPRRVTARRAGAAVRRPPRLGCAGPPSPRAAAAAGAVWNAAHAHAGTRLHSVPFSDGLTGRRTERGKCDCCHAARTHAPQLPHGCCARVCRCVGVGDGGRFVQRHSAPRRGASPA